MGVAGFRGRLGSWMSMDRGLGLSLVLLGIVVVGELRNSPHLVFWDRLGPGPSFLPAILALILAALAIPLLLSGRTVDKSALGGSTSDTVKYITLVALLAWLFPIAGGLTTMGLFVLAESLWVERYGWRTSMTAAAVAIGTVWIIFVLLLGVRLPTGPLGI